MRHLFLDGVTASPLFFCVMKEAMKPFLAYRHHSRFRKKEKDRERVIWDNNEEDEETTISPIADQRYPCGCTITLYKPIISPPRLTRALPCIYIPSDP